jgi:hypothetical protein
MSYAGKLIELLLHIFSYLRNLDLKEKNGHKHTRAFGGVNQWDVKGRKRGSKGERI